MFIREQIQRLQRRIKRIEENPRPEYVKSNKLRYEIELEGYLHIEEAWKAGKPFAILQGVEPLTEPLGFEWQGFVEWGDRATDPLRAGTRVVTGLPYLDNGRWAGFAGVECFCPGAKYSAALRGSQTLWRCDGSVALPFNRFTPQRTPPPGAPASGVA